MNVYMYKADLHCEGCGKKIRKELRAEGKAPADSGNEHTYDSDDYPKGPYPDGGGEADCPCHCGTCGAFLGNDLTGEGCDYAIRAIAEAVCDARHDSAAVEEWEPFYGEYLDQSEIAALVYDIMLTRMQEQKKEDEALAALEAARLAPG